MWLQKGYGKYQGWKWDYYGESDLGWQFEMAMVLNETGNNILQMQNGTKMDMDEFSMKLSRRIWDGNEKNVSQQFFFKGFLNF